MRARAIREGSVGLLILLSVGLFGGLVLWLRGLNPGSRSYQTTFVFENTLGMQAGTAVRYRGVPVGRVIAINPSANAVQVLVEITQSNLVIPSSSTIEANQSGLIGETTIDITPTRQLTDAELALNPVQPDCDSTVIICAGDELKGDVGASYEALLRSADELANAFADPEILENLKISLTNATVLTDKAITLSDELTVLTKNLQGDIDPLFTSFEAAADNIGATAQQFEFTGKEVNSLIATNRASVATTLTNVSVSSERLRQIMDTLGPAIENGEFIQNLETLSANAAAAATDIRDITSAFNTQENLMTLQQTLDSARSVFQSAQKVLADVDQITGDPALRNNIRNLINGLSNLVSLTHKLDQDAQVAKALATNADHPVPDRVTLTALSPAQAATVSHQISPKPLLINLDGRYYQVNVGANQPQPPTPLPSVAPVSQP